MNDDLISRSKLIEDIEKIHMYIKGLRSGKSVLADMLEKYAAAVKEVIKEQPTAQDKKQIAKKPVGLWYLPKCGFCYGMVGEGVTKFNYCADCGNKVDWSEVE